MAGTFASYSEAAAEASQRAEVCGFTNTVVRTPSGWTWVWDESTPENPSPRDLLDKLERLIGSEEPDQDEEQIAEAFSDIETEEWLEADHRSQFGLQPPERGEDPYEDYFNLMEDAGEDPGPR